LDHVRAWPVGPTAPTNLMALCRHHHRIKQLPGWNVRITPTAVATWTDPTRHETTTWPIDHLHLITATRASRTTDGTHPGAAPTPRNALAEIMSTFEERVIDLLDDFLDGPDDAQLRVHPEMFDAYGRPIGEPTRADLDHSPGWNRYLIDFSPPQPQEPEPIPF
ncbi:MAG: HNH endonuclease signature motif containing protein, partial [Knoellia sp.]